MATSIEAKASCRSAIVDCMRGRGRMSYSTIRRECGNPPGFQAVMAEMRDEGTLRYTVNSSKRSTWELVG